MPHKVRLILIGLVFMSFQLYATEPATGPVIENFGPAFTLPEGTFNLLPDQEYKILMDIGEGPDDPAALNRNIETAARFLNMHSRNGIKPENLKLAIVLHGSATKSALNDEAQAKIFDVPNGNKDLLKALGLAGVQIYVCGQSAYHHGYGVEDLLSEATMAVSAMTAHVRLQQDGYQAILF
ncbi:MAG: intracellular sulfur oxidation DsrE/DsrF family protein [Lysobacterales bacterium]|jgi:intracellular sulfur oxidation DsrE/DsrF family protein